MISHEALNSVLKKVSHALWSKKGRIWHNTEVYDLQYLADHFSLIEKWKGEIAMLNLATIEKEVPPFG